MKKTPFLARLVAEIARYGPRGRAPLVKVEGGAVVHMRLAGASPVSMRENFVPLPPPRRHDRSESDVERLSRLLTETQKQLSQAEHVAWSSAESSHALATQLHDLQMEHETALSDLDTTRERADLLESEKEQLQAQVLSQHEKLQRAHDEAAGQQQRCIEESRQRQAAETLASEMQLQNLRLEDRAHQLEREILELEDAEATREGEAAQAATLVLDSAAERSADGALGRAVNLLKKENQRLKELLRCADEKTKTAETAVRELERKLYKSGEVNKFRQVHLNELHMKIQSERQVWEQLQKVEQQVLVRQQQVLEDKVRQAHAREIEVRSGLDEFLRDLREHLHLNQIDIGNWRQRLSPAGHGGSEAKSGAHQSRSDSKHGSTRSSGCFSFFVIPPHARGTNPCKCILYDYSLRWYRWVPFIPSFNFLRL